MVGVLNVGRGYKKIAGAGMAGLGATIGALLLTGKLFAAFPLAGVGGFVITAPHIAGAQFSLQPSLTATDQQQGWPAAMISIQQNLNIDQGFELTKHFDLSATPIGGLIPSADLNIVSKTLTGSGLLLDSTGLQAKVLKFTNFNAAEQYAKTDTAVTDQGVEGSITVNGNNTKGAIDPTKQLGLTADTVDLTQAAINTDALKTSNLELDGLKLAVVANAYNDPTNPSAGTTSVGNFNYDDNYDTANPLDTTY